MFRRRDDPNAEIQDYLDRETQRNIDAGMTPGDAVFAARRKLGSVARVAEETREAAAGGVWTWFEMIWRDVVHGVRMFAKNPGFTLTCVLSLAFGTGANVAMFSVADALLFRPLPVPRPREIVTVGSEHNTSDFTYVGTSYPNYIDIRDQSRSFQGLAAYSSFVAGFAAHPGEVATVRRCVAVTGNFFEVMDVKPLLGRTFRPEEDRVGGRDAVIVLSYPLWQELGADPNIIGRTVEIGTIGFQVVGVMPKSFAGTDRDHPPAFYIPMLMSPRVSSNAISLDDRATWELTVNGRLRGGISPTQAQAELDTIAKDLERAHPDTNRNQRLVLRTALQMNIRRVRVFTAFAAILAVLGIAILIVACANVAGLLTSRAPLRAREISLRLAVGAGRARLVRQLLTESSLIAVAGGLLGLPLAYLVIQLMRQIQFPTDLIVIPAMQLDHRALLFSLTVAMGSVLLFGLIPAIQTTRGSLTHAFKAGDTELGQRRLWGRNLLVASQVAAAMLVLTVAVFIYRSFAGELNPGGMGFRTSRLLMVSVDPALLHYDDAHFLRFFEELTRRTRALPGVESVALSSAQPLGFHNVATIQPEGFRSGNGVDSAMIFYARVDEGYFETLAIPILRGRGFAPTDTASAPRVAVVNETFAAHYWPNQDAVGKRIHVNGLGWVQVVGVARNSRYIFIGEAPTEYMYFSYRQAQPGYLTVFVASAGASATLAAPMRELLKDLDPNMPIGDLQTMEHFYDAMAVRISQVLTEIVGGMGLMGVGLSMIGLYALMSYSVSRRTREIGIRMAVGADRMNVMKMVVRQGLAPVIAGVTAGLALSAGAGRLLRASFPLGYEIGPAIYGLIAPVLLAIAMAAALFPARRAALVDPMTALRDE